ncbi:biotin-dependent carboxyltransferase family protein [Mammaliicoccus sp. Dog046]|uniref:5-oxoprolinase subunit C family protein n=1 Tax=Mammaliicoccus sp. Dog046 TaxID=3034233 RepID=UPI002B25926D|nr:biotin-dependent carboxyltransferase family protein [Mammaliicoccus sp. Dog046]WQK86544.1 biotin-dependent carboxyltransferase family protein [Mammaliicoccus sp. Dog046]
MKCLKPGLFTTIQDMGRYQYEKDGFSVAGVMNQYFYKIANALVGNDDAPVFEITINGPQLKFNEPNIFAFVAYDAEIFVDEHPVLVNTAIYVDKGQILNLKKITKGARGYLSFYKSLDIEPVLGSVSTHTRSGIGGYQGRTLNKGDILQFKDKPMNHDLIGNTFHIDRDESYDEIPILEGLQFDSFDPSSQKLLTEQRYCISDMSDRMGYRLNGDEKLIHKDTADIISEPIAAGSVQVPTDGQPIILLNDRQTIGGYTKIATVTFIGREKLANLKANDTLKFKWVSYEEAITNFKTYMNQIDNDIHAIKQKKYKDLSNIRPKSKKIAKLIKGE